MSLSTRRPAGIPGSVRPPRSTSVVRGRDSSRAPNDSPPPTSGSDNKFRTQSQRSRSVPRQGSDNPYRSRRAEEAPPLPHSSSSRHSVQSSVSSSSSGGNSVVSAASTAPSSIWDYVGLKSNGAGSGGERGDEERSNDVEESHAVPADGSTIWSRVAAVAGGLSINVSKAWDAKDDLPEPDTPPGQDSRVTTALKKHYIKQVSDPRQLPAWLFSDIERQVGRSTSRRAEAAPPTEQYQSRSSPSSPVPAPVRVRARHEDAYAQPQTRERTRTATYDEEHTGPTRAATRLRALRDARRGPMEREREAYAPPVEPEPMRESERVQVAPTPAPARPRVGLPPRPGRIRRE